MNSQPQRSSYPWTTMLVAAFLVPSLAFGASVGTPVPPRVIVIFDSSSSMAQTPTGAAPGLLNLEDTGGDNDGGTCLTKFCIAKQVMANVIPAFSTDVRIGLAHYYQFITKYQTANTQQTKCYYDRMYKPGVAFEWTSTTDLGATWTGIPGNISSGPMCRITGALGAPAAAHTYVNTKFATPVATTYRCGDYDYGSAASKTYAAAPPTYAGMNTRVTSRAQDCVGGGQTYTQTMGPTQWNTPTSAPTGLMNPATNYIRQWLGSGTPMAGDCPPAKLWPQAPGSPTVSLTAPSLGTGVNQWEGIQAGECTVGAPCQMYSISNMPALATSRDSHFGLYSSPTFTPANPGGTVLSAAHTNLGNVCTNNNCLTGWTNWSTAMCLPTGTYNSGAQTWATFGIPATNAAPFSGQVPGGYTENTPNRTNPTCTAAQPCYITQLATGSQLSYNPAFPVYNATPNPSATIPVGSLVTGPTTPGTTYWRLTSSCPPTGDPAITNVTSNAGFIPSNSPTGCSGTANMDCSFTRVSTNAMVGNGCSPTNPTRYDGTMQPDCSSPIGTFPYTAGAPATINPVVSLPPNGDCATLPAVGTLVAPGMNGCPGGSATSCTLLAKTPGVGAAVSQTRDQIAPTPAGFTGGYTSSTPVGSPVRDTNALRQQKAFPPTCPTGTFTSADPGLCVGAGVSAPCDLVGLGSMNDGLSGETQLYSCFYQPMTYTWSGNNVDCTMQYTGVPWTVPATGPVCTYQRPEYSVQTPGPMVYRCRYQAPESRHDYDINNNRFCEYYRVRSVYSYDTYNYSYRYLTKGGELASNYNGSAWANDHVVTAAASAQLCRTAYSNDAGFVPSGECPPYVDNCGGANFYCMPRRGRSAVAALGTGRYQWTNNGSGSPMAPNGAPCMAPDQWDGGVSPLAPITASQQFDGGTKTGATPNSDTACLNLGSPSVDDFKLVSDWYDPAATNAASDLSPSSNYSTHLLPITNPSYTYVANANTATKAQGLSGILHPDGGVTSSQIFVPVGADSPLPPITAISNAFGPCELPNASNTDATTLQYTPKGICYPQDNYKNDAGINDFTPLYGSLKNAKTYIDELRAADDPNLNACRKYYVLLATDGKENTPAGFGPTDLGNAVDSLCGPKDANGKCTNASTYVVAFGSGATADLVTMDDMALRGGTLSAFPSTDQAGLQLALTNVFSAISAGSFSRSKPSLSTDGTRLYASSFTKCGATLATGLKGCVKSDGVTPDPRQNGMWKGFMDAYLLTSTGPLPKWELSSKMNGVGQPTPRTILTNPTTAPYTACTSPPCPGEPVDTSNALLLTALESPAAPSPTQLPGAAIATWLDNSSLDEPYYFDHTGAEPSTTSHRTSRVHDIQHSQAIVVGRSPHGLDWGGATPGERTNYQTYQTSVSARPVRILVGSNDGVLHGIVERDATCGSDETLSTCPNGNEAWAWALGEQMTNSNNGLFQHLIGHRTGVDGTASIADVCGQIVAGASTDATACLSTDWKTVALLTAREGGTHVTGLQLDNAGGPPQFLWDYSDSKLGQTWSMPSIGRVTTGGMEKFAAVFGGGRNMVPNGTATIGANVGESIYVVDALSGQQLKRWTGAPILAEMAGRPAIFRRPLSPYLDSSVLASVDGSLKVVRFANPAGAQLSAGSWKLFDFFRPGRNKDRTDISGITGVVDTIVRTPAWDVALTPTDVPVYTLVSTSTACSNPTLCPPGDTALPISVTPVPAIYNRPKVVPNGSGTAADYFVGSGDAVAIELAAATIQVNYFYALRDRNTQATPGPAVQDDGQPIFTIRMPRAYEQIVSEPALINGAVIVASYTPPQSGGCGNEGDTTLYAFDPGTGALTPALVDPNYGSLPDGGVAAVPDGGTAPGGGIATSVVNLPGVGIPSDLLVVDNTLYFNSSAGGLVSRQLKQKPTVGDIRSFRKVR